VDEVIRKAQGRERENGFCARVSWPVMAGRFDGVRKASSSGGFVPWTEQDSGKLFLCGVWRVSAETARQGIKVRRATSWACMVSAGSCGAFGPFDLCLNRSGEWVTRKCGGATTGSNATSGSIAAAAARPGLTDGTIEARVHA